MTKWDRVMKTLCKWERAGKISYFCKSFIFLSLKENIILGILIYTLFKEKNVSSLESKACLLHLPPTWYLFHNYCLEEIHTWFRLQYSIESNLSLTERNSVWIQQGSLQRHSIRQSKCKLGLIAKDFLTF